MGLKILSGKNISNGDEIPISEASSTDIDTSFKKSTEKDNLPNIFSGLKSGIMVDSALLTGRIPRWKSFDVTYPFVGITGYSTHDAIRPVNNREIGSLEDFFSILLSDSKVRSALANVVSNGGIPPDSHLFYPNVSIDSVGKRGTSKSLSVFIPTEDTTAVQKRLGELGVQQCLDIDSNGELFVNPNRHPKTMFYPIGRDYAKSEASYAVSKMTVEDLCGIVENMGGRENLIGKLRESFNSYVSIRVSEMNGNAGIEERSFGKQRATNPNYFRFFDFFKEIYRGITDEKLNEQLRIKPSVITDYFVKWLEGNDVRAICDMFIRKYYFLTPFEQTYCMRRYEDMVKIGGDDVRRDFEIFKACISNQSSEKAYDIVMRINGMSKDGRTESSSTAEAASYNGGRLNTDDMKKSLMDICRNVVSGGHLVYCFDVKEDTSTVLKDNRSVVTRHEGVKRMFVVVDGKSASRKFTLNYDFFFERYGAQLDGNADRRFNAINISGKAITYEYDHSVESSVNSGSENFSEELLAAYSNGGNEPLKEPITFKFCYFIDKDFISSGYEKPKNAYFVDMSDTRAPQVLDKEVYGVTEDRIRSEYIYAENRVGLVNASNFKHAEIVNKKRGVRQGRD